MSETMTKEIIQSIEMNLSRRNDHENQFELFFTVVCGKI